METLPSVHLRAMEPEDLDTLYSIENDPTLWNVSTTNVPYSRYVLCEYVSTSKNDIYADRQVRLMIEDGQENVVGIVDIIDFDPRHLRAEIGIVIRQHLRNHGYALATMEMVKRYALELLHLHQLYVCIDKENIDSINLFEKSGFVKTSELKEWLFDGRNYHSALLMQLFL
ncbi:MAG: GNAT family N-acetyltransferase [Prevotella sp.]|nr:GNAT family N-acetyltransferase [Prevotella sp.]